MTAKQKKFVLEYLIDLNATQAAIRAGYSKKTAMQIASRLLSNVNVSQAIQKAQAKLAEKTGVTAERVIEELSRLAFSNIKKFASWNGSSVTLTDSEALSEGDAVCVSELASTASEFGNSVRFKLHSKPDALEKLGKHLGLWEVVRMQHERDMAALKMQGLEKLATEIPALVLYEYGDESPQGESTH